MSDSYVAGLRAKLLSASLSPSPAAISVPPLPLNPSYPYLIIQQIAGKETESLTGKSGLVRTIMQVSCWSGNYEQAWNMREAVKTLLLGYRGSAGTRVIDGVTHNADREFFDGDRKLHQHITALFIWWES